MTLQLDSRAGKAQTVTLSASTLPPMPRDDAPSAVKGLRWPQLHAVCRCQLLLLGLSGQQDTLSPHQAVGGRGHSHVTGCQSHSAKPEAQGKGATHHEATGHGQPSHTEPFTAYHTLDTGQVTAYGGHSKQLLGLRWHQHR